MSDPLIKPVEFTTAVAKLAGKIPVGADLSSAQWAKVPMALRDRAIFTARLASASKMQELKDQILSASTPAEFVAKARPWMAANGIGRLPAGNGLEDNLDLTNHAGTKRLELIYDHNIRSARGYGWWKEGQNPDVLDAFPAQQLVRVESRHAPRDWKAKWDSFGGPSPDGQMIALKNDTIWKEISRFGTPFPPFDFGSGMGVDDVTREEAEAMGLLAPGAPVHGDEREFNDDLQASVKGLDKDMVEEIKASFGDQVEVTNDVIHWKGDRSFVPAPVAPPQPNKAPVSAALDVRTPGLHGQKIKSAIAAIDHAHDDGVLGKIPVASQVSSRNTLGVYSHSLISGKGVSINIKNAPSYWPRLTTIHEIGHYLDHQALGTAGKFASETHPDLDGFRNAAKASKAIQAIASNPSITRADKLYLLSNKEVWARAYAQYIAEVSNDPVLKAELLRCHLGGGSQWDASDFQGLFAEIEKLLIKKGWKK